MKNPRTLILPSLLIATLVLLPPTTRLHAARSPRNEKAGRTTFARTDTIPGPLAKLAEGFEHLTSLHFRAVARVTRASGKTGGGVFEYWMSADKFRARCKTDPSLGLVQPLDLSWTGRTSFLYLDDDSLTFGSKRRTWVPTAVPNPLLLVYSFLEPESVDYGERLNLATLDWLERPEAWSGFAAEARKQGNQPDAARWKVTLSRDGHPITVELRSDPAAGLVVDRISRRSPGNNGTSAISVKDYATIPTKEGNGIVAIPRTLAVTYQPDDGAKPLQAFDYRLTLITVDHPIPARIFVLKPKPGAHLWDEDQRKFVKKVPTER